MSQPTSEPIDNPYVGPRTFTEAERSLFFGREREARDLTARIVSERLLLFYAQSGAGKSSLINTRVIPRLCDEEGFQVLPVGRASGELPAGVESATNLYAFSLMTGLDQSGEPSARLAGLTLSEFLARLAGETVAHEDGRRTRRWVYKPDAAVERPAAAAEPATRAGPRFVLIIDQFEEIITGHPGQWGEREEFFRQLNQALADDPNLWVVLTLREDYVAALDPYAPLLFNRLRARFYMERMGADAALDAVRRPAELGGRPFAPGVAERLVEDLRLVRLPGQVGTVPGKYVEPVQLQVVCYQLWENIKGRAPGPITAADLREAGDVDRALTQFYQETLAAVLVDPGAEGVSERRLRAWFDGELITEAGTRGLVHQSETETGGLPNGVVRALQRRFLVRAEARGGDTWIELVHDRFVEPIRRANRAWFEAHLSLFQRQAVLWQQQDRPDSLLLRGDALAEAERWADAHPAEQEPHEKDFLAAGRKARGDLAERLALTAEVLLKQRRDLALLLAAEATQVAATPASRNSLLGSLQDDVHVGQLTLPQVSQGHTGVVNCVAVSPDGKLFATGGGDTKILLWNLAERKPIGEPLLGHSGTILILAFSPDGRILASAGQDRRILLWDVATHQQAGPPLCGHYRPVWGIAISPDGRLLASGDQAGNIVLWDLWTWMPSEDGPELTAPPSWRTVHYLKGHKQAVWSLAFHPQGDLLASASLDGTVALWNVRTRRQAAVLAEHASLDVHTNKVLCVAFSKDGTRLASSDSGGWVLVWDVTKRQRILTLKGHEQLVPGIEFSPDGARLVSGSWDKKVIIWDAITGNEVHPPLSGHSERISSVAFTEAGREVVSADLGGTVLVWDVGSGAQVSPPLVEHKVSANSVAITPDGTTLIGGCSDGSLVLWSLPAGQIQGAPLRGHRNTVSWVRVSPDGERLVSADWDGSLVVWLTAKRRPLVTLREHQAAVYGAAFSPDGRSLASCGGDGQVLIWSCDDGRLLKELMVKGGSALSVAYQPGGSLLASAHQDGAVRLWDPASGQLRGKLEGHREAVYILAWHPAGRLLASGGRDGRVWLWDAEAQRAAMEPLSMKQTHDALAEHGRLVDNVRHVYPDWARQWGSNQTVSSLAFSPDGGLMASGAVSGAIALWDLESVSLLGLPLWSGSPIALDMAFTPDGSQLISAHSDGTIHRWATSDAAWRSLARGLAGRDLTPEERQVYLK